MTERKYTAEDVAKFIAADRRAHAYLIRNEGDGLLENFEMEGAFYRDNVPEEVREQVDTDIWFTKEIDAYQGPYHRGSRATIPTEHFDKLNQERRDRLRKMAESIGLKTESPTKWVGKGWTRGY